MWSLEVQGNKLEVKVFDESGYQIETQTLELDSDDSMYELGLLFETLEAYCFENGDCVVFRDRQVNSIKELRGILSKFLPMSNIPA